MNETSSPRSVTAEVVRVENVTSRWRRVVIDTKEALPFIKPHFERVVDGACPGAFHMAFFFPVRHADADLAPKVSGPFVDIFLVDPALYGDPDVECVTRRMYTVRPVDGDPRYLELNFALRGDGLAMKWSQRAEVGMPLLIDMGGRRVVHADEFPAVGKYLLMGDETSIPTIAAMVQGLPDGSDANVCIEVTDSDDQWPLETNATTTLEWSHRGGQEAGTTDFMVEYCKNFAWSTDDVYVWAAAEGRQINALRTYLRDDVGLKRGQYQLMGYWRRGVSTERMLEAEAAIANERLAAGLTAFERPANDDQDHKTPYEVLHAERILSLDGGDTA